jgi:hypothetical protein
MKSLIERGRAREVLKIPGDPRLRVKFLAHVRQVACSAELITVQ